MHAHIIMYQYTSMHVLYTDPHIGIATYHYNDIHAVHGFGPRNYVQMHMMLLGVVYIASRFHSREIAMCLLIQPIMYCWKHCYQK